MMEGMVLFTKRGSHAALQGFVGAQNKKQKSEYKMKNTFVKTVGGMALVLLLVGGTQMFGNGQHSEKHQRGIEGAWRTVITGVNCQTGVPLGPPFPGLQTFNEGGTMSEYGIGPGSSPALRSPGHGVWQHEHGRQNYSYAFTYYRYDSSGVFIGSQKVTSELELGANGDEFISRSAVSALDANDNVIATYCATASGTRFE